MTKTLSIIPIERIERAIYLIRGHKVMLDHDLAELYGVETRVLVQAVKRNLERFPQDFMFQLSEAELKNWRSQIVISRPSLKMGLRRRPYAFTEHGAVMLASVLRSPTAIQASIQVVRAFVRLREILATHKQLAHKLLELEKKIGKHAILIANIIDRLTAPPPEPKRRPLGFLAKDEKE